MYREDADVKGRHQRTAWLTVLGVAAVAWAAAGAAAYTTAAGGQRTAILNAVHEQWRLEVPKSVPCGHRRSGRIPHELGTHLLYLP